MSGPFPHLAAYLERLPAGLRSYPECRAKGLLLRSAVEGHRPLPTWQTLSAEVRDAIEHPPLATVWVSAVLVDAVFYVIADSYYPTPEAMVAWTYERSARLASMPVYKMLSRVLSPSVFLRSAARIHAMFQQGTDFKLQLGHKQATVRLTHPPYLHMGLNHLSNVAVFRAVLESAGAAEVRVELVDSQAEHADYACTWQE